MGWTSKGYRKAHTEFDKDDAKKLLEREVLEGYQLIDMELVKDNKQHEVYASVRHPRGHVFGLVVLVSIEKDEIYWKEMDETVGPSYYNASKVIIDKLSPTDSQYAREWRENCLR